MLVGGPLDGEFLTFPARNVVKLQRMPRPGPIEDPLPAGAERALGEYQAEFIEGLRFYRHSSISLRYAVNLLMLFYLPIARPGLSLAIEPLSSSGPLLEHDAKPTGD